MFFITKGKFQESRNRASLSHPVNAHLGPGLPQGRALPDLCGTETLREEYQFIPNRDEEEGLHTGVEAVRMISI